MNKNMKFEDAMSALEDITRKLELGDLSLEDSITAYEQAVALIKICNERLEAAEKKVKIITESGAGVSVSDFAAQNED